MEISKEEYQRALLVVHHYEKNEMANLKRMAILNMDRNNPSIVKANKERGYEILAFFEGTALIESIRRLSDDAVFHVKDEVRIKGEDYTWNIQWFLDRESDGSNRKLIAVDEMNDYYGNGYFDVIEHVN